MFGVVVGGMIAAYTVANIECCDTVIYAASCGHDSSLSAAKQTWLETVLYIFQDSVWVVGVFYGYISRVSVLHIMSTDMLAGFTGDFDDDEISHGVFDSLTTPFTVPGLDAAAKTPTDVVVAAASDDSEEEADTPTLSAPKPVVGPIAGRKKLSISDIPTSARKRTVTPREQLMSMIREIVPKVGQVTVDGRTYHTLDRFVADFMSDGNLWLVWSESLGPMYVQGVKTDKNRIKKRFSFVKPCPGSPSMCDTYADAIRIGVLGGIETLADKRAYLQRMVDGLDETADSVVWATYGRVGVAAAAATMAADGESPVRATKRAKVSPVVAEACDDDDMSPRDLLAVVVGVRTTLKFVEHYFRSRLNGST